MKIKHLKKYGVYGSSTCTIINGVCNKGKLVLHKETYTRMENYGSGGWVEGQELRTRTTEAHFLYSEDGQFIGIVNPSNHLFMKDETFQLLLCSDEALAKTNFVKIIT
jgi:hypothetical protein